MNKQENINPSKNETSPNKSTEEAIIPLESQEVDLIHKAEQALISIEETSTQVTGAALETAGFIDKKPLSSLQKDKFRTRLERKIKKMVRILSFATLLTSAVGVADYELTRYKVEIKIESNGDVTYAHEDPLTTHAINVLAGKEKFNDSDKLKMPTVNPVQNDFDPELYDALWQLNKKCGSPKVNFKSPGETSMLGSFSLGKNFYNPYTNTIFIDIRDSETNIANYIAELSHGKQFDQNPISSNLLAVKGILQSIKEGVSNKANFVTPQINTISRRIEIGIKKSYKHRYNEPGTLEYDAHEVIEPSLHSEFKALTPTKTAKEKEENLRQEKKEALYKSRKTR